MIFTLPPNHMKNVAEPPYPVQTMFPKHASSQEP